MQKTVRVVVDPAAKLEEELIIRPTSETIIWNTYKNWISHTVTCLFSVTSGQMFSVGKCVPVFSCVLPNFLWQEGHTAHATREEAEEEAIRMLNVYGEFAENIWLFPL